MENEINSRNKILITASRLFQLQGYHATGLNQIIKESGSHKGSLYYYFPGGKEELAVESIQLSCELIENKIRKSMEMFDDPIEAIQALIKEVSKEINQLTDIIPSSVSLLALETSLISETLRGVCQRTFKTWENGYTEKLIKSGYNQEKAEEMGVVIQLMMEGALISSLTKNDSAPLNYVAKHIAVLLKDKQ